MQEKLKIVLSATLLVLFINMLLVGCNLLEQCPGKATVQACIKKQYKNEK